MNPEVKSAGGGWLPIAIVVVAALALVSLMLASNRQTSNRLRALRDLDALRDGKTRACEGARTRAAVIVHALGKPELEAEAAAAGRELVTWAAYCRGDRITMPTDVDAGQLRYFLSTFAQGD